MKTVYIAHPLRGDVVKNYNRVNEICRQLHATGQVIPLSPLHAFSFVDPAGDQDRVFEYCRQLLSKCDELWLHGEWEKSEGCCMEADFARDNGIPVLVKERVS